MDYQAMIRDINTKYQTELKNLQNAAQQEQQAALQNARNGYNPYGYNPYGQTPQMQQPMQSPEQSVTPVAPAQAEEVAIPVPMQQLAVLGKISATMEKLASLIEERIPISLEEVVEAAQEDVPEVITFTEEATPKTKTNAQAKK